MSGEAVLIALCAAGLWYGATKTIAGAKQVNHRIARAFHHTKAAPDGARKADHQ